MMWQKVMNVEHLVDWEVSEEIKYPKKIYLSAILHDWTWCYQAVKAVTTHLSYGTALFQKIFFHYSISLYQALGYVTLNEMRGRWAGSSCNLFVDTNMSFIWKDWGKRKPQPVVQKLTWFLQNTSQTHYHQINTSLLKIKFLLYLTSMIRDGISG